MILYKGNLFILRIEIGIPTFSDVQAALAAILNKMFEPLPGTLVLNDLRNSQVSPILQLKVRLLEEVYDGRNQKP